VRNLPENDIISQKVSAIVTLYRTFSSKLAFEKSYPETESLFYSACSSEVTLETSLLKYIS